MCYKEETTIDLSPGVNAVIGANDRGKSTILAACGWVVTGKPAGSTVMSWDGSDLTEVELLFSDGMSITRSREGESNSYLLMLQDGSEMEFKAFGNSVPDEIVDSLAFDDINFQGQANNIFPMQLTAGEFGNLVNKYFRLDEIHTTMKRLTSESKRWAGEESSAALKIEAAEEEIAKLGWVSGAEGKLDVVEGKLRAASAKQEQAKRIREILILLQEARDSIPALAKIIDLANPIARASKAAAKASELRNTASKTSDQLVELNEAQKKTAELSKILAVRDAVRTAKKKAERAEKLRKDGKAVTGLLNTLATDVNKQLLHQQQIHTLSQKITAIRKSLPPVCPLCGNVTIRRRK